MPNTYYVTTPIYYVNDKPHIGHLCTTLAADVLARYQRLRGQDVFFLTGTDEHGAKIAEAAAHAQKDPKAYCDEYAEKFQHNWDDLGLSYDFFIRTTNPQHELVVKKFIQTVYDKKDIYKGVYEGLYCIGCERFLTQTDLVDGRCPLHPTKEPIQQKEENYFFRLSKYQDQIYQAITDPHHPHRYSIYPEDKKQEILNKISQGLEDISISRAEVSWGIPIPWDPQQTIYVWFEALLNYYTATQFLADKRHFWPANLHIVGKDISWFHTVIWQAMLLSAGVALPKQILVHSFYISESQKMSKSIGNVIAPGELIDTFGLEATRYLILTTFPFPTDSDITLAYFKEKYHADLANGLGNLVQRVAKMCEKHHLEVHPLPTTTLFEATANNLDRYDFPNALSHIWQLIHQADQYIDQHKPWTLNTPDAQPHLVHLVTQIQAIANNLRPFMPKSAEQILAIFSGKVTTPPTPLFPRV